MIVIKTDILYSTPDNIEFQEYIDSLDESVIIFNTADPDGLFTKKIKSLKRHDNIAIIMDYKHYIVDIRELLYKFAKYNIALSIYNHYFYENLEDIINRTNDNSYKKIYKKYHHIFASYKINEWLELSYSINDGHIKTPNCIIADMDSTICFNTTGRSFYEPTHMDLDVTNTPIVNIIKNYLDCNPESILIVITGRTEHDCKEITYEYLSSIFPKYLDRLILHMRRYDDNSPAHMYKEKYVKEEIIPHYNIDFALDDDPRIIEAYRNLGITALLVNHLCEY